MSEATRPWWSLRRPAGMLWWTAAFLAFAGFVVPLIHANRFRRQIQTALEQALGRRVEIGEITLRLLPAPGFQMENVVVGEDPAFGAEHFAYMTSMQARVRLRALWTGQVQLASLTLAEPSLNLVKNAQGKWNFETLMERAGGAAAAYSPYIGIDDGRVNFKFGDDKSVFHFQDVEAALSPPRDAGGRWFVRFGGRPARTDQVLSGMGRVRGEGSLTPGPQPAVNLELALDESPMSYLLRLVEGRDHGVHGTLGARLKLSGELSRVRVEGTLQVDDVHRWDVMPGHTGQVETPFQGTWDLPGQSLRLETAGRQAVRGEFTLQHYLSRPEWRGTVELQGMTAAPLVRVARHFGAALPADLELKGTLEGRIEFAGSAWPQGSVRLEEGRLATRGSPEMELGTAEVALEGKQFVLRATPVRVGKETLDVAASGDLNPFRVEAQIVARGARLEALRVPAPASVAAGVWDGRVVYRQEPGEPGAWSGVGTLSAARWQPKGLEAPVEIASARVRWDAHGVQVEGISGAVGETKFTGSCRAAEGESTCRLRVRELELGQLDRWLRPRQVASRWAVWKRALGLDSAQPGAWLKTARVEGSIQVDRLAVGKWTFRNVRSGLAWKNGTLLLTGLRGEAGKGVVSGAVQVEFAGSMPRYSIQTTVRGVDLRSLAESGTLPENFQRGVADLRVGLVAVGRTASELRASLNVHGVFEGRGIALEDVQTEPQGDALGTVEIRLLEGQFEWNRLGLQLSKLKMALGKDLYEGRGSIGGRSAVALDMSSGVRQWRLISDRAEAPAAGQP